MNGRTFSQKEIRDIQYHYRHGETIASLMKYYHVDQSKIRNLLTEEDMKAAKISRAFFRKLRPSKKRVLSQEEKKKIDVLYEKKQSLKTISKETGLTITLVGNYLREKHGLNKKYAGKSYDPAMIALEYKNGVPLEEIQRKYNISNPIIYRCLQDGPNRYA